MAKKRKELNKHQWGFAQVWNKTLEDSEPREYKKRDRIWASELGNAPVDVWMKMQGNIPSNPPNPRSLRKFEAGNIWEWLAELILRRAGILQDKQEWVEFQFEGLLPVTGKLDFLAGGIPNYDKAENSLMEMGLPDIFLRAGKNIVKQLKEKYPNGLESRVLEIKSSSTFIFDRIERTGHPLRNHSLQLFHYLKAKDMERGAVVYICRDDCRMFESLVSNPSAVGDDYKNTIEMLTKYHRSGERPPLEEPIEFDAEEGKFSKNWGIEYSGYLTELYGFKKPKDYYDKFSPLVSGWNRVLTRIEKGQKMTDNNKEKLIEMKEYGFDIAKIKELKEQFKAKLK